MKNAISRPSGFFTSEILAAFAAIRKHGIGFIPENVNPRSYQTAITILQSDSPDSLRSNFAPANRFAGRSFENHYFGPSRPLAAPVALADPLAGRSFAAEITNIETGVSRIAEFLAGRRS
jgi:hypothetical protein